MECSVSRSLAVSGDGGFGRQDGHGELGFGVGRATNAAVVVVGGLYQEEVR